MKANLCLWPGRPALNPYVENFCTALESRGHATEAFSPQRWIRSMTSFDALFVHWPEAAVAGRPELVQQVAHRSFIASLQYYRRRGGKVIWVFHNATPHDRAFLDLTGFAKQVDGIVSPSKTGLDVAVATFSFLSQVPQATIHIGAYDVQPPTVREKLEARHHLGLSPTATVAINCGAIRRYKGLDWPVSVFAEADPSEHCFLVVGTGVDEGYLHELRELANGSPSVRICADRISNEEMNLYLRASDIGVFTFARVLHSSSIINVRSMGLPVICSRAGSLTEYADFDRGLFLIDDSEDLLATVDRTIAQWTSEPAPLPSEYDWNHIGEQLNLFLHSVLI